MRSFRHSSKSGRHFDSHSDVPDEQEDKSWNQDSLFVALPTTEVTMNIFMINLLIHVYKKINMYEL